MTSKSERRLFVAISFAIALLAGPAKAEVVSSGASGFVVRHHVHLTANPAAVFAAIGKPSRWWSAEHTYSGDASNLKLDLRAGGCWCERLPKGGSVQHMIVVNVQPEKLLRLLGALGPLQGLAVNGVMTWTVVPESDGTGLDMTYAVAGYASEGLEKLAMPVDGVLGDQVRRLKSFTETGSPETNSQQGKEKS